MRTKILKDILLYLITPEDTTEARGDFAAGSAPSVGQIWLGPLKTVFWTSMAIAAPVLLFAMMT